MNQTLLASTLFLSALACSSVENRDPTGELFPAVKGEGLDGSSVSLPNDLAGAPAILLVGYVQDTQFDLDRWMLGLAQAGTPGRVLELPTIDGMASLFSSRIDEGMRGGIPQEDWPVVVTLYDAAAEKVLALTGDERPRNGRVLLLDNQGHVAWFHDRGYSTGNLLALDAAVRELLAAGKTPDNAPVAPVIDAL
ncbi:MAG: hypothetical protein ACI9EF_003819 [Pseudohongiellaceae bacterium]|jgi:hypothetical protein